MPYDHILLIGYGAPEQPDDVLPFLEEATRGVRVSRERLEEVRSHYDLLGGASPYNGACYRLCNQLFEALGGSVPVYVGMKNWHPFLKDTLRAIGEAGGKRGLGLVLAPHRSEASFDRYVQAVNQAQKDARLQGLSYTYPAPWHEDARFVEAWAHQVRMELGRLRSEAFPEPVLLFSAHSIPTDMAEKSNYAAEFRATAGAVAQAAGVRPDRIALAYQSRSGNPKQPWLEPDVLQAAKALADKGETCVLTVPVGFLCENVEILYDLDTELREECVRLGMQYARAGTVMDHPKFLEMLAGYLTPQSG
ncbi:MAG: ferrochelatase [Candidatus Omnitrophica bacterium]|nr:ferrochelatase [Candidatus Omnitrophota bacterium]